MISSYFPSTSTATSSRVQLDSRTHHPVRAAPLGQSSLTEYHPRVHRPGIVCVAPHPLRVPANRSEFSGGWREPCPRPLSVTDLWINGTAAGPPPVVAVEDHHKFCICLHLKSHPVTFVDLFPVVLFTRLILFFRAGCGHSYCYTCIHMSLEFKWECPSCRAIMTQPPIRAFAEDDNMRSTYGAWDTTQVDYGWEGLIFPEHNGDSQ
jgi:hypothetical protein